MVGFSFSANKKILFGWGETLSLVPLLKDQKGRVFFITGKSVKKNPLWKSLELELRREGIKADFEEISGEPSPEDVDSLCEQYRSSPPAVVVALGGGSVLDAGKAVSAMLRETGSVMEYLEGVGTKKPSGAKIPFFALPTTAGTGSECTKNAVLSRPGIKGFKKSLRHDNYIPDLALIDPQWLESLPREVIASCGMDAFSQLLESYISTEASPLSDALAEEGLTEFLEAFGVVLEGNAGKDEFSSIALGATLSGLTLANAGLGTVHGIAGVLGGLIEIPHGTACGLLLPPVMNGTFQELLKLDEDHPTLQKAAGLGQFLSGRMDLKTEESIQILMEELDRWTTLAALPGLKTLGLTEELLVRTAMESGNKNNPYSFSEEERLSFLRSVY
ncbi:iron-containing alcohol dehydrogenase [Oceanispirochaeta sp.]|uniref:iron-containing alcohol dehydrogenase n=1 Tax=Oceanispirochaeta sp. TaxID=2035350 RepID=UPI00261551D4|nr:iron-containing alcohol dehydrogenase [Oceanispirochaeta sp.]MDA3956466.1 iron-containing alcohol dehydrogenase [Oceanispirochaeta sp.]